MTRDARNAKGSGLAASWVAALVAASCASASPSPQTSAAQVAPGSTAIAATPVAPPSKPSERDAQQRVAEWLQRVAAARHLPARAAVEARELDRAALIASVREHVAREIPPDVIRNQGELLIGFGLVPPDFDYEEGAFRLLEAQLAGFYEPHDKKMYLAADLPARAADATLAHELVHALQDQHYDLGKGLSYKPEANDRESALQALAEGDATSAMMDLLLKDAPRHPSAIDVPDDVFAAQVESSMTGTPESTTVPRVLRASLVAPYVDGVIFVHGLRRRGLAKRADDGGWSAVDEAWRTPPETTSDRAAGSVVGNDLRRRLRRRRTSHRSRRLGAGQNCGGRRARLGRRSRLALSREGVERRGGSLCTWGKRVGTPPRRRVAHALRPRSQGP